MRALHLVKTSDGARWAAWQAGVLKQLGIEVHVALPDDAGEAVPYWHEAGAHIHVVDCNLPTGKPHHFPARREALKSLIAQVQPDLIHSHFVTTTLLLRLTLGKDHPTPRFFQIPGPLHMEHGFFRRLDLATAGRNDYWIPSSDYTRRLYERAGVPREQLFLSYYGLRFPDTVERRHDLRRRFEIPDSYHVIGNVNFMYPPKYYLGQTRGLKRHEDVIDALGLICQQRRDVVGLLVGGQWGKGTRYEQQLHVRARRVAGDRIVFTGRVPQQEATGLWGNFDLAVHVPISENCGGVQEPLLYRIPTIASNVGGIPELVLPGDTGWLVPPDAPSVLAKTVLDVLEQPEEAQRRAAVGEQLFRVMFAVDRTAHEISAIYDHVLANKARPEPFDPRAIVASMDESGARAS
jgi:glycosyltransferase involved in cell wall biosynthesis